MGRAEEGVDSYRRAQYVRGPVAKRRKRTHRAVEPIPASRQENRASQSDRGHAWLGGYRAIIAILAVAMLIAFVGWLYRNPSNVSRMENAAERLQTPSVAIPAE